MKADFKTRFKKFKKNFLRDRQLYLLILLPLIYVIIFDYGPMYGVQIAFKNFNLGKGIWGSEWVGFKWFEKFLTNYQFKNIFLNTLLLSLYSLLTFPLPIIFALMLNSLRQEKYKKFIQTVSYVPHFISVTVLVAILNMIFSPIFGLYGNLYRLLGGTGYPVDFRATKEAFRHLYVWSGVWQQLGWNAIIYISALSSVSQELHEAAQIDGASRFKRMIHIDLPAILPTACIMLILRSGSIISVGFEKVYLMQSTINLDVAETISTYVYKNGMNKFTNYSYGAAIGLFNNVINLIMLLLVNKIANRLTNKEVSLF